MRILLIHNGYQQRGGEDAVFAAERSLLEREGHDVAVYERHNDEIKDYSWLRRADLARRTVWATDSTRAISSLLSGFRPQVAHFHNTFPLVSPAAYHTCAAAGVPVVQRLPNYRLICPGSYLLRDGQPCEDCVGRAVPWPGVRYGCYRGSRSQSAVVAAMLAFHRMAGTWDEKVDVYVALTEFGRERFIEGGLPRHKIAVKPNFVHPDPGPRDATKDYALFVGRLSAEKGIATLLHAWEQISGVPLKIAGDGPMRADIEQASQAHRPGTVELLGWRSRAEILALMKEARFLIFPSEWYEGHPNTIIEALSCGLPVVGARLGAVGETVDDGVSGLLFEPGNSGDLARAVVRMRNDPALCRDLSRGARSQFETHYTADRSYTMLMEIYEKARSGRS